MGSQHCRIVGKSQPVLMMMMINPVLFTRSCTCACAATGWLGLGWCVHTGAQPVSLWLPQPCHRTHAHSHFSLSVR
jgi:hypothetical protein